MKNIVTLLLFVFISTGSYSQKSKVIAVFQLIDNGNFEEAKEAVDESIRDEKTRYWAKTYYAKGYLCQKAYEKGKKDKKKKLYELYPDQLYLAYESYARALRLDRSGRLDNQIAPLYVLLANELLKEAENQFENNNYSEALRAYEHVMIINKSSILEVKTDTNLIYNAAIAAYKGGDWDKTREYLEPLNDNSYSANIPHLLYATYLEQNDTVSAVQTLVNGVSRYEGDENLVMLLIDLLVKAGEQEHAIHILDSVSVVYPDNYIFPYAKGLAFQTMEKYDEAIDAYEYAIGLDPDRAKLYVNIGTCYYNKGIEIQDKARTISSNNIYLEEKKRAREAFGHSVEWLEKAESKGSNDTLVSELLDQLYRILNLQKAPPA
ncbi:MAG TPA: tetratricopeptide repeat protein [Bacteroidales bacterium]|nr:tetratricopeptide repeat protein [Bacteroidales bacterium]